MDRLLSSAAGVFNKHLTVVLLSGANTGSQFGIRAVRENGGRVVMRMRATAMVAEPLDQVADSGLANAEVDPDNLVKTVIDGFDANH